MAALTYLDLVNRARRECGVSGIALTTLQSGLTIDQQRFADWVNEAWSDVQLARSDWLWMRGNFSFNTVASTSNYAASATSATNFGDWRRGSFRCYTTSVSPTAADEQILPFMDWDTFRNVYQFGNMRNVTGRPVVFSVGPDHSLWIGPVPDGTYTVIGEYQRCPVTLSADADCPVTSTNPIPERYQMLVVYRAMKSYGMYASAGEIIERATKEERRLLQQMTTWALPVITAGPPLA